MTDPIKLAIEALRDMHDGWKYIRHSHGDLYGVGWDRAQTKAEEALTALRSIKPPCQMCVRYYRLYEPETSIAGIRIVSKDACFATDCTNYDKFTPMPPVCLTKEKS
jgi:hypothetical protein